MNKFYKLSIITVLVLIVFTLGGCSALNNSLLDNTDTGQLVLSVADAPAELQSVNVAIDEILVHNATTEEWITLEDFESDEYENGSKEVNLLDYQLDELAIADKQIPEGDYNQIRLILDGEKEKEGSGPPILTNSTIEYVKDGNEESENIFVPSEKLIINAENNDHEFNAFRVSEDGVTRIVLDFDVSSLKRQIDGTTNKPTIILEPTAIDVVNDSITSSIVGEIVLEDSISSDIDLIETEVNIEIVDNEDSVVKSTSSIINDPETAGQFKLRGIEKGEYTIKASVEVDSVSYSAEKNIEISSEDIDDPSPKNIGEITLTEVTQ